MWITRIAINHPVFATMVMVALLVLGLFSYQKLGVEALPDITPPVISISVQYPGASPEQGENDIAKPIENAVNSVAGIKMIRSYSGEGFIWTAVEFRLDVDQNRVMQEVRDKVAQVRADFPRDAKEPVITRGDTENDQPVASFALVGEHLSQRDLTSLAEQVVQKRFERVNGVGRVTLGGTVSRQVQINVRPERLTAFGLSVDQVLAAVRAANISFPVGTIATDRLETIVRVDGRMANAAAFEKIVVARKGNAPVLLSQVADVADGEREATSYSRIDGRPSIGVWVYKAQDANIVDVGHRVKQATDDLKKLLPAGSELKFLWASSDWVERSLTNVKTTILEGGLLTVLIVFLFLGSWRSTVITGLTLPIAVIATFTAIYAFGFTLNYMTLMALSLCIGLLIDDAIVVRENIVRHIHLGKDHHRAAREGTDEIGLAVLATTFSIVAVFVPIAFMSGIVGKFFYPFGITVAVAVLVSLFVSFTLDPMLSAVWRDPPEGARRLPVIGPVVRAFEHAMDWVHRAYDALLRLALAHRKTTLAIAIASFAVSLPIAGVVGGELMPQVDQSFTSVLLRAPVGSSIDYTNERVRRVEEALRDFKEVEFLDTQVGAEGTNTARINLRLTPRAERTRTQQQIEQAVRERVARIPGVELRVGFNVPIYVALLGNNDADLNRVMSDFKEKVKKIEGIRDVDITVKEGTPALSVRLRPELASEYGITHAQLGTTLRALVAGDSAGNWLAADGQNYDVVVRLPRASRAVIDDIGNLNIPTGRSLADGSPEMVPLRAIATIERTFNPDNIRRQDLQRRVALFANVEGRPAGDVGKEVTKLVESYELPAGMRFDIGGDVREQQDVMTAIIGALLLAVIFIYIVLASQFGSFLQPLAIMVSLPLSIVGVMLALLITHTTLNIFSMIGIVFLMGLVTKNAMLLVDFANQGQRNGLTRVDALLAAGQTRLRPILMTTAAMIFGMLPLALGLGEGAEQQAPMGRAIIGGVVTSTFLTLVVVPVIYSYIDALEARFFKRTRTHGVPALAAQPTDKVH